MSDDQRVSHGAYTLIYSGHGDGGHVEKNGEKLGHFWPDKYGGYAVFFSGNAKAASRPKTVRGCVLKLTGGAWDGKPSSGNGKNGDT